MGNNDFNTWIINYIISKIQSICWCCGGALIHLLRSKLHQMDAGVDKLPMYQWQSICIKCDELFN